MKHESRWQGLELRHLAALSAIHRTGSFHGAAEYLGYTQSTVSEQIASLERIVRTRLVDRTGGSRETSLTPAGELLLHHVGAIFHRLHAAEADVEALAAGEAGSLRVGTYQSASRRILPTLVQHFSAQFPRIAVHLTEAADDSEFFPLVEQGALDLAFAVFPVPAAALASIELLVDPYVLVLMAGTPIASRASPLRLSDLSTQPLIGFRQRRSVAPVEEHLRSRGIEGLIGFRSDDYGTVEAMVASGLGAALVPRLTVSQSDPRVVVRELDDDLPPRRIALIWHRDRLLTSPMEAFIAHARDVCAALYNTGV